MLLCSRKSPEMVDSYLDVVLIVLIDGSWWELERGLLCFFMLFILFIMLDSVESLNSPLLDVDV